MKLSIKILDKNNLNKRLKTNKRIKLIMIQNQMIQKKQLKFNQCLNQFSGFKKIKYTFIIVTDVKLMFRWVFRVPNVEK